MLIPSLMSLVVATVAAWVSVNTKEEVVQVALGLISLLSALLALFFAPWTIKILAIALPLLLERIQRASLGKPS